MNKTYEHTSIQPALSNILMILKRVTMVSYVSRYFVQEFLFFLFFTFFNIFFFFSTMSRQQLIGISVASNFGCFYTHQNFMCFLWREPKIWQQQKIDDSNMFFGINISLVRYHMHSSKMLNARRTFSLTQWWWFIIIFIIFHSCLPLSFFLSSLALRILEWMAAWFLSLSVWQFRVNIHMK